MAFDIKKYTTRDSLDRNSFLWSELRLVIAAVALFIGGRPPVLAFNPIPAFYGLLSFFLWVAWIVSGAVSVYLVYRWNQNGRMIFGGKNPKDIYAFFINVISGINLGLVGIMGSNIGMSISSNTIVFLLVGALYLISAYHLFKGWKSHGERIF